MYVVQSWTKLVESKEYRTLFINALTYKCIKIFHPFLPHCSMIAIHLALFSQHNNIDKNKMGEGFGKK